MYFKKKYTPHDKKNTNNISGSIIVADHKIFKLNTISATETQYSFFVKRFFILIKIPDIRPKINEFVIKTARKFSWPKILNIREINRG